jgi:hypothetical protein
MSQMKKYRNRWSYDPRATKAAQELPTLTMAIIIKGVIAALAIWAMICLAWLAF